VWYWLILVFSMNQKSVKALCATCHFFLPHKNAIQIFSCRHKVNIWFYFDLIGKKVCFGDQEKCSKLLLIMVSYVDIVCLLMTKYPHLTIILPPVTLHFNNVTLYEKPSKNVNVYTSAARCLFRASVPKLYRMSYEGSVTQLSVLSR